MGRVFISYSTRDQNIADQVLAELEGRGWKVWCCARNEDNPPGKNWVQQLADALEDCDVVLVLFTFASAASKYVAREVQWAVGADKPIIVVRLDESELRGGMAYLLSTLQWLDASSTPAVDAWIEQACRAIQPHLDTNLPLPIDSISDRQLKVELCTAIRQQIFEGQGIYVTGLGIRLTGLTKCWNAQPAATERTYKHVRSILADLAAVDQQRCVLPFVAKENVFLLLVLELQRTPATNEFLRQVASQLIRYCGDQENDCDLAIHCNLGEPLQWRVTQDDEELAGFLTKLGAREPERVTRVEAADLPDPPNGELSVRGQQLLKGFLHKRPAAKQTVLPKFLTRVTVRDHLLQLFTDSVTGRC